MKNPAGRAAKNLGGAVTLKPRIGRGADHEDRLLTETAYSDGYERGKMDGFSAGLEAGYGQALAEVLSAGFGEFAHMTVWQLGKPGYKAPLSRLLRAYNSALRSLTRG